MSTGQGPLGYNMFAYCRNNPVCRIDIAGATDTVSYSDDGEIFSSRDLEDNGGGGANYFDAQQNLLDGNFSGSYSSSVPQKAWDVLNFLKGNKWHPPQNYKGGKPYENDGRDNSEKLPDSGAPYYEYDINPKVKGVDRGLERIVTNRNGMSWYTLDHYTSFIRME